MQASVTTLDIELLPWQTTAIQNSEDERFQVIAAGRRCGKSRYVAWRLLLTALNNDPGEVWYVGLTQGNARDVMWGLLHELGRDVIKSSHVNNLQITLVNDRKISLKGSDRPETMRGSSLKFVALDEAAFMKPYVWEEILRPALSDRQGDAVFISTPEGRNWFYDLYVYAETANDDEWASYHLTTYDNPIVARKEIDAAKRSMSSMAFHQEYEASFNAKESEYFKESWLKFSDKEPEIGDYFMAIDVAGFKTNMEKKVGRRDNTAISVVKVNEDGWWVKEIKYGRWGFDETVRHIFHLAQRYKPLAIGFEKGVGQQALMSPLQDMMRRHSKFFRIELLTHGNQNKEARILAALQMRMEHGRIKLSSGEWNTKFLDELLNFPTPLVTDDLVDSLAYIDQMAHETYIDIEDFEGEELEPLDWIAGY